MMLISSKTLSRLALGAACIASAAVGVSLDARAASANSYTVSPLIAVTKTSGDLSCLDKRYDGLRAAGCGAQSVYAYLPLHRDEDLTTTLGAIYVRYGQTSQPLYCVLETLSAEGSYGFVESATAPAGARNETLSFAISDKITQRASMTLSCRMFINDHKLWGVRVAE
jgi:hypothetical protein